MLLCQSGIWPADFRVNWKPTATWGFGVSPASRFSRAWKVWDHVMISVRTLWLKQMIHCATFGRNSTVSRTCTLSHCATFWTGLHFSPWVTSTVQSFSESTVGVDGLPWAVRQNWFHCAVPPRQPYGWDRTDTLSLFCPTHRRLDGSVTKTKVISLSCHTQRHTGSNATGTELISLTCPIHRHDSSRVARTEFSVIALFHTDTSTASWLCQRTS